MDLLSKACAPKIDEDNNANTVVTTETVTTTDENGNPVTKTITTKTVTKKPGGGATAETSAATEDPARQGSPFDEMKTKLLADGKEMKAKLFSDGQAMMRSMQDEMKRLKDLAMEKMKKGGEDKNNNSVSVSSQVVKTDDGSGPVTKTTVVTTSGKGTSEDPQAAIDNKAMEDEMKKMREDAMAQMKEAGAAPTGENVSVKTEIVTENGVTTKVVTTDNGDGNPTVTKTVISADS